MPFFFDLDVLVIELLKVNLFVYVLGVDESVVVLKVTVLGTLLLCAVPRSDAASREALPSQASQGSKGPLENNQDQDDQRGACEHDHVVLPKPLWVEVLGVLHPEPSGVEI